MWPFKKKKPPFKKEELRTIAAARASTPAYDPSTDMLNPMNILSPFSPFNPVNQIPDTHYPSFDSSPSCDSSSSSYDSGSSYDSSSSCDSSSSSSSSD